MVLGRSAGLSDEEMEHIMDDVPPDGMFSPDERAIIAFTKASALMEPITEQLWADLAAHFTTKQIMEISFTIGLDQLVSRFHATVRTDLDESTYDAVAHSCKVRLPAPAL